MESFRQYIINVVSSAAICTMLTALLPKGTGKEIIKFLCGIFLTISILDPVSGLSFNELEQYIPEFREEAEAAIHSGQQMAQQAKTDIIIAQTEAYILDKATLLNTDLSVKIKVDEFSNPVSIILSGKVSPFARKQLEKILVSDLGITKENQEWTG